MCCQFEAGRDLSTLQTTQVAATKQMRAIQIPSTRALFVQNYNIHNTYSIQNMTVDFFVLVIMFVIIYVLLYFLIIKSKKIEISTTCSHGLI